MNHAQETVNKREADQEVFDFNQRKNQYKDLGISEINSQLAKSNAYLRQRRFEEQVNEYINKLELVK